MTLRIGILGAARVATYALIAPARDEVDGVTVAAVAARDRSRAAAYAEAHNIPHVEDDYAALIASPHVDAVYNALPPGLHARWSIAALEAGKPVLCEKPFALSLADVDAMLEAEGRTGQLLMEARHSHYHPLAARMRALVQGGTLGRIVGVDACFTAPVADTGDELRYLPDVGGGALWDLGVYPASWIRDVTGEEPRVVGVERRLHAGGADVATTAHLVTASGATARLHCDMTDALSASLRVTGTRGRLDIRNPLAPQRGHGFALTLDGVTREESFPLRSTYAYQLDAFRDAVRGGTAVRTRGDDSRALIAMLAAIADWRA